MGWSDTDVMTTGGSLGMSPGPGASPSWGREVRRSCRYLSAGGPQFVVVLHSRLLELLPRLQVLVHDPAAVTAELADGLLWAALADSEPPAVEDRLRQLGSQLCERGFPDDGYLALSHAVLRAARMMHGAEWTSGLSAAWVAYLTWFTSQVAQGVQAARREAAPRPPSRPESRPPSRPESRSEPRPEPQQLSRPRSQQQARPQPRPQVAPQPVAPLADAGRTPSAGVGPLVAGAAGLDGFVSVDQVLVRLRERHFPLQARALRCPAEARQNAVGLAAEVRALDVLCGLVSASTGVDLRSPRPEHEFDPTLVGRILATLHDLGYDLSPALEPPAGHRAPG